MQLSEWCRVVKHNDVTALFYQEADPDNGEDTVALVLQTDSENVVITYRQDTPFSQEEFDRVASANTVESAVKMLAQVGVVPR